MTNRSPRARVARLESATGTKPVGVEPRINVKILDHGEGPLRGYRIGTRDVLRAAGESDSELLSRVLAALDHESKEDNMVRVFEEIRRR